jgi:hypothetical protein
MARLICLPAAAPPVDGAAPIEKVPLAQPIVRPVGMFRGLGISQLTRLCMGFRCVCVVVAWV